MTEATELEILPLSVYGPEDDDSKKNSEELQQPQHQTKPNALSPRGTPKSQRSSFRGKGASWRLGSFKKKRSQPEEAEAELDKAPDPPSPTMGRIRSQSLVVPDSRPNSIIPGERRFGLILFNIQLDMFQGGALPVPDANDDFVQGIVSLKRDNTWFLSVTASSQHPSSHMMFTSNVAGSQPFTALKGEDTVQFPDHCVLGSLGAAPHPDLPIHLHDVSLDLGLKADVLDLSAFSTEHFQNLDSLIRLHLERSCLTDIVIAGLDIDGEAILSTGERCNQMGMNVHVVQDHCLTLYEADDVWDVCHNAGLNLVTLDRVHQLMQDQSREPVFGEHFKERRFRAIIDMALLDQANLEELSALLDTCQDEVCKAHPRTGLYLIHYLTRIKTQAACFIVTQLLDRKLVSRNVTSEVESMTPLMEACKQGNVLMAETLVRHDPSAEQIILDLSDCHGRTALIHAIMAREVGVVRLIVDHPLGGPGLLHARDSSQRNVLMLACQFADNMRNPKLDEAGRGVSPLRDAETGIDVLDFLWDNFQSRDFVEDNIDMGQWTFWNYAVRHGLTRHIKMAIQEFTLPTEQEEDEENHIPSNMMLSEDRKDPPRQNNMFSLMQRTTSASLHPNRGVTRAKVRNNFNDNGRTTLLAHVLTIHSTYGQALLHQVVWQRKEKMLPFLLDLYHREDLLQECTEHGFSALDLVAQDPDPTLAFALIRAGCTPRQRSGLDMYHLGLCALLMGAVDVVRNIVMKEEYGVTVDHQLIEIVSRIKATKACTANISAPNMALTQPSFRCGECEELRPGAIYCCVCVYYCHYGHEGLRCEGTEAFHCADSQDTSCRCRRGHKSFDTLFDQFGDTAGADESDKPGNRKTRRMSIRNTSLVSDSDGYMKAPKTSRFRRAGTNVSEKSATGISLQLAPGQVELMRQNLSFRDMLRHIFVMSFAQGAQDHMIEELVKYVKPDCAIDETLDRPLHVAARHGHVSTCSILKRNGARLNVTNKHGETPLHLAAMYGFVEVCEEVAHASNTLKMDNCGLTPLHHAVRNDKSAAAEWISLYLRHRSKVSVDINFHYFHPGCSNSLPQSRFRPMRKGSVAGRNYSGMMKRGSLPNVHADQVDTKDVNDKVLSIPAGYCEGHASPLHLAVRYGHVECARVLMKHGQSPLHVDATGFSPYQTAIWELYVTHERLQSHEDHLRQSLLGDVASVSHGHKFTRNSEKKHNDTAENSRFVEINKDMLPNARVLKLSVLRELLDTLAEAHAVEHHRKRFAYQSLTRWVLGYLVVLVFFIAFTVPRSSNRYYLSRMLDDSIEKSGWSNITEMADAQDWFYHTLQSQETLLPALLFDGELRGLQLLGSVRLRQVRANERECNLPDYAHNIPSSQSCHWPRVTSKTESREGLSFTPDVTSLDPTNAQHVADALRWREADGVDLALDFGTYTPNGYFVDLDLTTRTSAENADMLAALFAKDASNATWIDQFTRVLTVEFAMFNLNLNMFGFGLLSLEYGATGEVITTHTVLCHKFDLSPYDTFPSHGFKFAAFLILVFSFWSILSAVVRLGLVHTFHKSRFWFDMTLMGLALTLLVMDTIVTWRISDQNLDFSKTDEFQGSMDVAVLLSNETFVVGATLLVMWLRLIRYSVLLPRFGAVTYAFMNTMRNFEVMAYLLFMLFVIVGFILAFNLCFEQSLRTSTYEGNFNLLMQMMMGEWSEDVFVELPGVIRTFMFISFMIVVAVVFINLFISVLSEVYPKEKKRAEVQCANNLTALYETDFIRKTHKLHIGAHKNSDMFRNLIHSRIVVPFLLNISVILRIFSSHWNFDVPKSEFGWEKGRQFYKRGVVNDKVLEE